LTVIILYIVQFFPNVNKHWYTRLLLVLLFILLLILFHSQTHVLLWSYVPIHSDYSFVENWGFGGFPQIIKNNSKEFILNMRAERYHVLLHFFLNFVFFVKLRFGSFSQFSRKILDEFRIFKIWHLLHVDSFHTFKTDTKLEVCVFPPNCQEKS